LPANHKELETLPKIMKQPGMPKGADEYGFVYSLKHFVLPSIFRSVKPKYFWDKYADGK